MKRLLDQIGTIGIVTVVTMLVWLYAEDANIVEYTSQSVRLQFVVPAESKGLLSVNGPVTVEVDFNSSNGQHQQFINNTRGQVIEIYLPFDESLDLETIDVDIREQLERYVFNDLGINLTRVSPDIMPVTLEKFVDITLPVRVIQETGPINLSSVQIPNESERQITLNLRASEAQRLQDVSAIVRVSQEDVVNLPKGLPQQLRLTVELPEEFSDLRLPAQTIGVLATVADDRGTVVIDRRPILLSYPSSINDNYIVTIDESERFINTFELEGPRAQIELISQDQSTPAVWATIRLSNDEAGAAAAGDGVLTRTVEIIAPSGVVLSSEIERRTIRVRPRDAPRP